MDIPHKETEIVELWRKHHCFETLNEERKNSELYVFYDGPPFATGKPHYGHILAGTMKDVITRYQSMKGKNVPRRFGWDCHGLPVENLVDKQLHIQSTKTDIDIASYNQECRKVVMQCEKDWEYTVERMGRWIDFEHSYKTMDKNYMNHLWKIFHQLYQKGLIYQGKKVMPFSVLLGTPLSNFEANLNYKTISQPDAYVLFPLEADPNTFFLAWTTTPWTLLSHVALCLHPTKTYLVYKEEPTQKRYIVSSTFVPPPTWMLEKETLGEDWKGCRYHAPFQYFPRTHTVLCDTYVKDEVGTGIIHLSPAFGEDDYRVCKEHGIVPDSFPCPLTLQGCFTQEMGEFAGVSVTDAVKHVLQVLKQKGLLWKQSMVTHSYPHCWRTDTPLIYRTVPSWFLHVEKIKDVCIEQNKKVHWVPEHIGIQRFHNWLEQAKDWALSRTRLWGTPIPIWMSEDGEEMVVISSVEELEACTGETVLDLHREHIDHLCIPSRQGKGNLRRIPEVFDCWYESGAVPIVQSQGPAEFVAEGLDQTRGWFYTMLVLYTALYDEPPYKNVLCSGLVLASDGKKMSKRLQNYPDPLKIMETYGADALRMYLLDSPVVKGETLRFKEEGVFAICKEILIPLLNAVVFWETYATKGVSAPPSFSSPMDRWIMQYVHSFVRKMEEGLASYQLWNLVGYTRSCVDILTNTYIRMNRYRWKEQDVEASYTLFYVLDTIVKTIAPMAPFMSEWIYQRLHSTEMFQSVHYHRYPEVPSHVSQDAEELFSMEVLQRIIELSRKIRGQQKVPLKQPLSFMKVVYPCKTTVLFLETHMVEILQLELNVEQIVFETKLDDYVSRSFVPNLPKIGKRFGKQAKELLQQLAQGFLSAELIVGEEVTYQYTRKQEIDSNYVGEVEKDLLVLLDMERTERLIEEGEIREYLSLVNLLRKDHQQKAWNICTLQMTSLRKVEMQERLQELVGKNTTILFNLEEKTSSYHYGEVYLMLV